MSSTKPCLFYKVKLAADKTPILGTMQGYPNNKISDPCAEARVVPYQVAVTKECRPASGLRYFYKQDKRTGNILPNSMFAGTAKPTSMCSGQFNILEFIVTSVPSPAPAY